MTQTYVLIRKYVDVHIKFKKPIYDLEEYVHMVEEYDMLTGMNDDGRMEP